MMPPAVPPAAVIDGQSVKSAEKGANMGRPLTEPAMPQHSCENGRGSKGNLTEIKGAPVRFGRLRIRRSPHSSSKGRLLILDMHLSLTSINLKPSCMRPRWLGVTAPLLAAVEQNTRR
jgi:hypothetical protein